MLSRREAQLGHTDWPPAWVRETLQNGYSTRYLSAQTAGLYVESGEEKEVRVGCELELDGERWVVSSLEDGEVRCVAKATEQRADEDDEVLDSDEIIIDWPELMQC